MPDVENLVNGLTDKNDKYAYNCLQELKVIQSTNFLIFLQRC